MTEASVLLIDDEEDVRRSLGEALELEGFAVRTFARAELALERVGPTFDGVVVSDIRMPKMDGMALLSAIRELDNDLPVILMTGHGDVPLAVKAMRNGAYDFLEKPFSSQQLAAVVSRARTMRRLTIENRAMRAELADNDPLESVLIGASSAMVDVRRKLRAVADSDIDVLLTGETGTGKELAAKAIHDLSARREYPFVALCLASLPEATIEAELFGHEAGAFPGAHRARAGKFEHARGGTILLDEIGATPPALQAKLLRAIEQRTVTRLGSNEPLSLNVRIIAASNRNLKAMSTSGDFRSDLLYRLAAVTVVLPPLRDRLEDAPRLFQHLIRQAARRFERPAPSVSGETLASLSSHEWPGNVREMRNAAERFVLGLGVDEAAEQASAHSLADLIERFERGVIAATLTRHRGNLKATYETLGLSRKTLYDKMQRYDLRRQDFGQDADPESQSDQ